MTTIHSNDSPKPRTGDERGQRQQAVVRRRSSHEHCEPEELKPLELLPPGPEGKQPDDDLERTGTGTGTERSGCEEGKELQR